MAYLVFTNDGIANSAALRLMGASTKRDDNSKIGFFGSGFKYALALIIREGADIRLFLGEEEQIISYRLEGAWKEIIIDGRSTGLTTDLGPSWEPWMALRELYCNAVDGGNPQVAEAAVVPVSGSTVVAVQLTQAFQDAWNNRKDWLLFDREVIEDVPGHGRIYSGTGRIYRKGILVYSGASNLPFDFDLDFALISEDRRLLEPRMTAIWPLLTAASPKTKQAIVTSSTAIPWNPSTAGWKLPGLFVTREEVSFHAPPLPYTVVTEGWRDFLQSAGCETFRFKPWVSPRKVALTKQENHQLTTAIAIINRAGVRVSRLEIIVAEVLQDRALGCYANDIIYLSYTLFKYGQHQLIATLLHELAHRDSGAKDCTREFENHLTNWLAIFLLGR